MNNDIQFQYNKIYEKTKDFGRNQFVRRIQMLINENKQLKYELAKQNKTNEVLDIENQELSNKINKAIEYIEKNNETLYTFESDYDFEDESVVNYEPSNYREDILEILRGGSDENI